MREWLTSEHPSPWVERVHRGPPQISTASAEAAQLQPMSQVRSHTQRSQRCKSHCLEQELTPCEPLWVRCYACVL